MPSVRLLHIQDAINVQVGVSPDLLQLQTSIPEKEEVGKRR